MKSLPKVSPRNTALLVATFATCVTAALSIAVTSEAEGASPTTPSAITSQTIAGSITTAISDALTGTEPSTTAIPLSNSFQPTTPWPASTTISQTILQAPHNLLAYSGVEAASRQMLGLDYSQWRSHFGENAETKVLPQGLLYSSGCASDCDTQKSLLFVNPTTRRVYAAMVSGGKLSMWPSLMSWPDESIPTLKTWLADAAEDASSEE